MQEKKYTNNQNQKLYQHTVYRVASVNILLKIILQYCVGNPCQLADHLTSLNSYLISLLELVES